MDVATLSLAMADRLSSSETAKVSAPSSYTITLYAAGFMAISMSISSTTSSSTFASSMPPPYPSTRRGFTRTAGSLLRIKYVVTSLGA